MSGIFLLKFLNSSECLDVKGHILVVLHCRSPCTSLLYDPHGFVRFISLTTILATTAFPPKSHSPFFYYEKLTSPYFPPARSLAHSHASITFLPRTFRRILCSEPEKYSDETTRELGLGTTVCIFFASALQVNAFLLGRK